MFQILSESHVSYDSNAHSFNGYWQKLRNLSTFLATTTLLPKSGTLKFPPCNCFNWCLLKFSPQKASENFQWQVMFANFFYLISKVKKKTGFFYPPLTVVASALGTRNSRSCSEKIWKLVFLHLCRNLSETVQNDILRFLRVWENSECHSDTCFIPRVPRAPSSINILQLVERNLETFWYYWKLFSECPYNFPEFLRAPRIPRP